MYFMLSNVIKRQYIEIIRKYTTNAKIMLNLWQLMMYQDDCTDLSFFSVGIAKYLKTYISYALIICIEWIFKRSKPVNRNIKIENDITDAHRDPHSLVLYQVPQLKIDETET